MALWSACVLLCLLTAASGQSPVVSTRYGAVRGARVALGSDSYVDKFLGIPFAKPPKGDLRFRNPVTPDPWNGTRDATQFGHVCPQPPDSYLLPEQVFPQSEDCLFLNVYSPKVEDANARLPVMMWIHGGGFLTGSGSRFDWTQLANKGVVVVTINYRLSAFGFLSTEDSASPGNYGLQDQIMALTWVRDVITQFGGDPDNVTIFGESAGGASVSLLVMSSEARGLFHKAIVESGSALSPFAVQYPGGQPSPRQASERLARELTCDTTDTSRLVDCLRGKQDLDIGRVSNQLRSSGVGFGPVPEGTFGQPGVLSSTPESILRGNSFAQIPVMRGFNSDEGAIGIQDDDDSGFTMEEFRGRVQYMLTSNPSLDSPSTRSQLTDAYINASAALDPKLIRQAGVQIATDYSFVAPTLLELELAAEHDIPPQYLYQFAYRSANRLNPAWKGVMHVDEIPYVSGAPVAGIQALPNYVSAWTDDDIQLSDDVMTMWSNFAKYGNPTPVALDGVQWLPWTNSQPQLLEIGTTMRMVSDPVTPQQTLWIGLLSQMHASTTSGLVG